MASPTHNLVVKTGQYTTNDGPKNRWQKIGTVFRHDDGGTSIKLECMPVGVPEWDGWVSVFPVEQNNGATGNAGNGHHQGNTQRQHQQQQQQQRRPPPQAQPQQQQGGRTDFDDDIPF